MSDELGVNPFAITTPEELDADEVVELFVDVADYHKLLPPAHTFIHGARGTGKSMIFRWLEPDCQRAHLNRDLSELPFFAVYVKIKQSELQNTDMSQLDGHHGDAFLNEHFMVLFVAFKVFEALEKAYSGNPVLANDPEVLSGLQDQLSRCFKHMGETTRTVPGIGSQWLSNAKQALEDMYKEMLLYFRSIFPNRELRYDGPLAGYVDFLVPLVRAVRQLSIMPTGPVYILLDDADNLSRVQTQILNSWVATRTSTDISLKISTQLAYKTYRTVSGFTIDTPHDYSEIDLTQTYTTRFGPYLDGVKAIVQKRLARHATLCEMETVPTPEAYFPPNTEQDDRIAAMYTKIKEAAANNPRGYRPADDAYRYAIPEYIKSLKGPRKSGSTFSYSGFKQLVNISSGVIRDFLEPAARMYAEQKVGTSGTPVIAITHQIQNKIIREYSDEVMTVAFEKMDVEEPVESHTREMVHALHNLLRSMGSTFHRILLSDRSERRVFSIALTNYPDEQLQSILTLGVRLGYLHQSVIGNKEGTGRTRLYIMHRKLAPSFLLDPSGFAGYLFVTNRTLHEAMSNPSNLLRHIGPDGEEKDTEADQLILPFSEAL